MTNDRDPLVALADNTSFPLGEDKCIILDGFIWDGTAVDGDHVKIDTTTTNKIVQCGANEVGIGIAAFNKTGIDSSGNLVAKGTAPAAGQPARVCIHGPVEARVTSTSAGYMGTGLAAGAAGVLVDDADGTATVANVLDKRLKNASTAEPHIVFYKMVARNDT